MAGWKTWVAAVGSILWGIGGLLVQAHGPDGAAMFITGGFALIGIGHKVEKLGDVFKMAVETIGARKPN